MTRDMQSKLKKDNKQKKSDERSRRRKTNEQSDSDDGNSFSSEDEEEEDMDPQEYKKFLAKMFPSKYMNKKIQKGEDIKKFLKNMPHDDDDDEEEEEPKKKSSKSKKINKKLIKNNKKSKKKTKKEEEEESDEEDSDEDSEEDDDEEEEEEEKSGKKINIIFTIGHGHDDEDEEEWLDEDDSEWDDVDDETEDEDESVSTDDSDSDDEDSDDDDESEEEEEPSKKSHKRTNSKKNVTNKKEKVDDDEDKDEKSKIIEENIKISSEEEKTLKKLTELYENDKDNKVLKECLEVCKSKIKDKKKKTEKKLQKQKQKNGRIFKRILRDKNAMNDFTFFEKMNKEEQVKIIKEVREINKITRVEKPYRMTLLESKIPPIFKAAAMKKINSLRYMEPGSGEFYKIKNWVDTFMRIPFNKIETLPLTIDNGVEQCHEFMENAQKTLDSAVYGLNDAKMQIMQMLGQLITNPSAIGTAIAIHGPPGTGKTSLVKEGISKILNRPFAFIALGGATDSSFLEGHSYTYEGSVWGKIVQILIDSQCMNPVIYFDELDKISGTPKGEEIAGILTHLTDTAQNSQFHDKYFAEIDFDLSKCLFIFSYNDEKLVNPILKDRMYRIETKGYEKKQKTVIAKDYLLPKIREQVRFKSEDIIIPDESIHYIIETHCNKEDGVRNLKRCLEIIHTKLNLYRLMKPGVNLFEGEMSLKVEFPFTVSKDIVDKLIKKDSNDNASLYGLYV